MSSPGWNGVDPHLCSRRNARRFRREAFVPVRLGGTATDNRLQDQAVSAAWLQTGGK